VEEPPVRDSASPTTRTVAESREALETPAREVDGFDGEGRARAVVGPLSSRSRPTMRTAAERREALETPAREVDGVGPSTALFAGARSRRRLARARRWSTLKNAERHTDAQTAVIIAHSTAVSMSRWVERAGWEEINCVFYYCNIESGVVSEFPREIVLGYLPTGEILKSISAEVQFAHCTYHRIVWMMSPRFT